MGVRAAIESGAAEQPGYQIDVSRAVVGRQVRSAQAAGLSVPRQSASVHASGPDAKPCTDITRCDIPFAWLSELVPYHAAPGLRRIDRMLLFFFVVWAVLLVGVCAVCAAGGRADEERDRWFDDVQRSGSGADKKGGRDAA